jgi:hypothetical protein
MYENVSSDVDKERRRTDPWQADSIDVLSGGSHCANDEPGSHLHSPAVVTTSPHFSLINNIAECFEKWICSRYA